MLQFANYSEYPQFIRKTKHAQGLDISIDKDITIYTGKVNIVTLPVKIFFNKEVKPQIVLRSSLAAQGLFLFNGIGIIDYGYYDFLKLIVGYINESANSITLKAGQRVAQLITSDWKHVDDAIEITTYAYEKVVEDTLKEMENVKDFRKGGLGSTGL